MTSSLIFTENEKLFIKMFKKVLMTLWKDKTWVDYSFHSSPRHIEFIYAGAEYKMLHLEGQVRLEVKRKSGESVTVTLDNYWERLFTKMVNRRTAYEKQLEQQRIVKLFETKVS